MYVLVNLLCRYVFLYSDTFSDYRIFIKLCSFLLFMVDLMRKFPTTFRTLLRGAIMVLMHDYIRRANFTTKPRRIFTPLCVGILFSCTALGIHSCNILHLYILKTRLGGEIYSSDINMRKGYHQNLFESLLYVRRSFLSLRTPLYYGQFLWSQKCQKSYIPYLFNTETCKGDTWFCPFAVRVKEV